MENREKGKLLSIIRVWSVSVAAQGAVLFSSITTITIAYDGKFKLSNKE